MPSYKADAKAKKLKKSKDFEQIPHGDSLISADHLAKCGKDEAKIIAKMGLVDARDRKKPEADYIKALGLVVSG